MSTFKGVIDEFHDIRIDYFRPSKDPNARAPLACFLTHIHSDHIQGLDGFYGGPFIHCSAATKELLLRLERRIHRWNLAKSVLESRKCQYAEKKNKLKVLPMETPTIVELDTERSIRVTMFDANHCPGAVMFLIEGDGKAILYTGDIRAETWWVDYVGRHPVLVPYTSGIKRLDRIYLDTTFLAQKKKNQREGIRELIEKVNKYPPDTIFHLNAWTFGYEDIWVALAAAFNTKIHLSKYHFHLFTFIRAPEIYSQGPFLRGYKFGNADVAGCLTTNPEVRFHSCEWRSGCSGLEGKKNVVWITPVVTRVGEFDVYEVGSGDLENQDDLALHEDNLQLLLNGIGEDVDPSVKELLQDARKSRKQASPPLLNDGEESEELDLDKLVAKLSKSAQDKGNSKTLPIPDINIPTATGEFLPNKITILYSRHSSYSELRGLVSVFRPYDIYPCVADNKPWDETKSIEHLFGDLCEGSTFEYDEEMKKIFWEEQRIQDGLNEEQEMYQQQSQELLDRTDTEDKFIDIQLFKEQLERSDGLEESPGMHGVVRPLTPPAVDDLRSLRSSKLRIPKRSLEDEDNVTEEAQRSTIGAPKSSPSLPIGLEIQSNLTPLEAARLAGSSTASNSPQASKVSVTVESQERAAKKVKRSEDDESGFFEDELEAVPRVRWCYGGVDGRTWWDVGLSCTGEWRYEEETEL